jgi:hypothetical protein
MHLHYIMCIGVVNVINSIYMLRVALYSLSPVLGFFLADVGIFYF